jgi:hypothetical protein
MTAELTDQRLEELIRDLSAAMTITARLGDLVLARQQGRVLARLRRMYGTRKRREAK